MVRTSDTLLPSRMRRTLRYNTGLTLSAPVTGAITNYQFRLNSCFDPDLTSTGHQPMGYDQLCAMYNQWCVTRSRITVHAVMNSDPSYISGTSGFIGLFAVPNDSSVPTTVDQALENHVPVMQVMSGYQNRVTVQENFDHNIMFGLNLTQYLADDTFYGQISANPAKPIICNLFYGGIGAGASSLSSTLRADVVIEFDVTFKQAFVLASS